jgi:hypothetical protein
LLGEDVLELAVDRHSVETLEGLARDIGIQHSLLEVLDAWDGPGRGWLIIDALDATRGGKGEGVFRALIQAVLERAGRWQVVATVRSFDLRMGQQFRQLFKGQPPVDGLNDPAFAKVRHVHIPRWSDDEFKRLLKEIPSLSKALEHAPDRLRDLAKVPFNTRLLCELLARNLVESDLRHISSQAELLELYWDYRIEGHGLAARTCLRMIVESMVQAQALRASISAVDSMPEVIDALCHEGVISRIDCDRALQFRHHLLFDFSAAKLLFEPNLLISGDLRFSKGEARGLMLAPALGFVLKEIWDSESDHGKFWQSVGHLVSDENGDPIIRSAAGRIGAEYPLSPPDALWLADGALAGNPLALSILPHISGALAVRIEDEGTVELEPWVKLASALAPGARHVAGTLRFLLRLLIARISQADLRAEIGVTARALLAYMLTLQSPADNAVPDIGFVIDTYETAPDASRALLERIFAPARFDVHGSEEVPALCYKIKSIGEVDPKFVSYVFAYVYGNDVNIDRTTRLGNSQILSLTSNARQDYDMARYSLSEYFPRFLEIHPLAAIEAAVQAMEGYISREHPVAEWKRAEIIIAGKSVYLRQDLSHIWAHDPYSTYGRDAELLLKILLERLQSASEDAAIELAGMLLDKSSLAIFWSRLFLAATSRGGRLSDMLWPFAARGEFIVLLDTRKDAIDLVSSRFLQRSDDERLQLEKDAFEFDFSDFLYAESARSNVLQKLFTSIGLENLHTDAARKMAVDATDEAVENKRLFSPAVSWVSEQPYHWIRDLDRELPGNAKLIAAIESAKEELKLEPNEKVALALSISTALQPLFAVRDALAASDIHPWLRSNGEGVIGLGCVAIVSNNLVPTNTDLDSYAGQTSDLIGLTLLAVHSASPETEPNTEISFEKNASWSSPAARVEGTQALFDLIIKRPDLYVSLKVAAESLLRDPHPAVRLRATLSLGKFWDIDRETLWARLAERLDEETNLAVLVSVVNGLLSRILNHDPIRTFGLIQRILARDERDPQRLEKIRNVVSNPLAILWIRHSIEGAHAILAEWTLRPSIFSSELRVVLFTIRDALVAGLAEGDEENSDLRARSLAVLASIVTSANRELAVHHSREAPSDTEREVATESARVVDAACQQLLFAINPSGAHQSDKVRLSRVALTQFLHETSPILKCIGDYATPHTIYSLLQLLERLIDVDPGLVFDLAANALRAGKRSGYQNESMGIDLLVRMVGTFLADHKEIFELAGRRARLVDSLEIFMEAGWPAARRLLYRLPELMQ